MSDRFDLSCCLRFRQPLMTFIWLPNRTGARSGLWLVSSCSMPSFLAWILDLESQPVEVFILYVVARSFSYPRFLFFDGGTALGALASSLLAVIFNPTSWSSLVEFTALLCEHPIAHPSEGNAKWSSQHSWGSHCQCKSLTLDFRQVLFMPKCRNVSFGSSVDGKVQQRSCLSLHRFGDWHSVPHLGTGLEASFFLSTAWIFLVWPEILNFCEIDVIFMWFYVRYASSSWKILAILL